MSMNNLTKTMRTTIHKNVRSNISRQNGKSNKSLELLSKGYNFDIYVHKTNPFFIMDPLGIVDFNFLPKFINEKIHEPVSKIHIITKKRRKK